ncbi:MFS transporter [Oxyplasma meridianum]|uniref:MFS transporter n=2 Tax=Oxyplasma meridianum TaxID=3073602 RepID=A0AAX4NFC9_9ARCH
MEVYGLKKSEWMQVLSSWSGWVMDGYVSITYALVAVTISKVLFPPIYLALIATVLGFIVSAIARLLGSVILGNFFGDKLGRKTMLTVTVFFFSIFSASIALIPSFTQIGVIAPAILYLALFLVGFFAGAEYGGGTALATESVPPERRGFVGAFVQSGFGVGYFIVSLVFFALSSFYGQAGFQDFGWRVLFATSIVPGALALVLRLFTKESRIFTEMQKEKKVEKIPVKNMIKEVPLTLTFVIMITAGLLFVNGATLSFYPIVMEKFESIPYSTVGLAIALINLISLFGVWMGGMLSNRLGGRRISMAIYSLAFLITTYPLIYFGLSSNLFTVVAAFSVQAFIEATIFATLPAFLAEKFSKRYRSTAVGFAYNAGGIAASFSTTIILIFVAFHFSLINVWSFIVIGASLLMVAGIIFSSETWSSKYSKKSDDKISL